MCPHCLCGEQRASLHLLVAAAVRRLRGVMEAASLRPVDSGREVLVVAAAGESKGALAGSFHRFN